MHDIGDGMFQCCLCIVAWYTAAWTYYFRKILEDTSISQETGEEIVILGVSLVEVLGEQNMSYLNWGLHEFFFEWVKALLSLSRACLGPYSHYLNITTISVSAVYTRGAWCFISNVADRTCHLEHNKWCNTPTATWPIREIVCDSKGKRIGAQKDSRRSVLNVTFDRSLLFSNELMNKASY